jgi:hypothetical protein
MCLVLPEAENGGYQRQRAGRHRQRRLTAPSMVVAGTIAAM